MKYAIERDSDVSPYLLARLHWPDTAEAISPSNAEWKTDRRLFDMLYESTGEMMSEDDARNLGESWGSSLA